MVGVLGGGGCEAWECTDACIGCRIWGFWIVRGTAFDGSDYERRLRSSTEKRFDAPERILASDDYQLHDILIAPGRSNLRKFAQGIHSYLSLRFEVFNL